MNVLATLALIAATGLAGYWAARYGFRRRPGLDRALGASVVAWAWMTVGMEGLGSIGRLGLGPLLGWSGLGLALGLALRTARPAGLPAADRGELPGCAWGWEATLALGLVLWAAVLLTPASLLMPVKPISDGPIYHLYFAARWCKEGRLSLIATPFGENAAPYFPAGGDLWLAWLMAAWGGDGLARVGQVPFLLLAALALYAIARRLGAGRSASIVATCWAVACTPLCIFSFEPNVDTIFLAGYLVAVYFFVEDAAGGGDASSLALGSLAAGGALGSKATAIVFVPPVLALAALSVLRRPIGGPRKLARLGLISTLPLVMAGYWFGRNAWLSGNPLYPLHVSLFGRDWLAGWYGAGAMRSSRHYINPTEWRALVDLLLVLFDPRMAPAWVAALAGAWAIGRPASASDRWVRVVSWLVVLDVGLYWLVIPYRTQFRFLFPAEALAAVPLARLLDRGRWLRAGAVGLLAVHLLTPQGWPWADAGEEGKVPWDQSSLVPNAIDPLILLPLPAPAARAPGLKGEPSSAFPWVHLTLGMAALAAARGWRSAAEGPSSRRLAIAAMTTALASALAVILAHPWGSDPRLRAFPRSIDYASGWYLLDRIAGPGGARVAYSGTGYPYYLMGTGQRNEVRYVNVDAHRGWLLHDYHREARAAGRPTWHHSRPGWDREHPDYRSWLANLQSERIEYLFVVRTNPADGWLNNPSDRGFPIERSWADAHPDLFRRVDPDGQDDPTFRLYRVRRAPRGSVPGRK